MKAPGGKASLCWSIWEGLLGAGTFTRRPKEQIGGGGWRAGVLKRLPESSRLTGEKARPQWKLKVDKCGWNLHVWREKLPQRKQGPETLSGSATLKSLPASLKNKHPLPDSVPAGQDDNLINVSRLSQSIDFTVSPHYHYVYLPPCLPFSYKQQESRPMERTGSHFGNRINAHHGNRVGCQKTELRT